MALACALGAIGSTSALAQAALGDRALLGQDQSQDQSQDQIDAQALVIGMERVFEEAVARGIQSFEHQLVVVTPGLSLLAGPIRARGFVLEGYGTFFDVEYPVLRRSMLWSMRMLDPNASMSTSAAKMFPDRRLGPTTRSAGPSDLAFDQPATDRSAQVRDLAPTAAPPLSSDDELSALAATYLDALVDELRRAIITVGRSLRVSGDAWLTVAARNGRAPRAARRGAQGILQLRVRGRDFDALREGRLSIDEVTGRIDVRRP